MIEFTITLAQAQALRTALGAQAILVYARDPSDPTTGDAQKVLVAAVMDQKLGTVLLRFATAADQPTIAQAKAAFTSNVEVQAIA